MSRSLDKYIPSDRLVVHKPVLATPVRALAGANCPMAAHLTGGKSACSKGLPIDHSQYSVESFFHKSHFYARFVFCFFHDIPKVVVHCTTSLFGRPDWASSWREYSRRRNKNGMCQFLARQMAARAGGQYPVRFGGVGFP